MIRLARKHLEQMSAQASACLPEEACGLVGGLRDEGRLVIEVPNELHSPVRFRMEANQQLRAFISLEKAGLDLIAIYHSHPTGPATPSVTDLQEFYYPGVLALILSPESGGWRIRAFEMEPDTYREVSLVDA